MNQDGRFNALKGLGRAELGTGDLPRAQAHLEQALSVAKKTEVIWSELAEAQLALAEVLWTSEPDRERAVSLVRSAQRAYASHGASFLDQKDDIDTWLATHVLPTKAARPAIAKVPSPARGPPHRPRNFRAREGNGSYSISQTERT